MVWSGKDLKAHLFQPLLGAGLPSTSLGCPGSHPTWYWAPPGMEGCYPFMFLGTVTGKHWLQTHLYCAGIGLMQFQPPAVAWQGQPQAGSPAPHLCSTAVGALWSPMYSPMWYVQDFKGQMILASSAWQTFINFTEVSELFWLGFELEGSWFSLEREISSVSTA